MSLSIRQNLGSREAADAFNHKISDWRRWNPGCVSERACTHCYHVISDSICLCIGTFTCPKCGGGNGVKIEYIPPITTWPISLTGVAQSAPETYIMGAGI